MEQRLENSWTQVKAMHPDSTKAANALIKTFPLADRTVPNILKHQADLYGDKLLFSCRNRQISFADSQRTAALWGGVLERAGVTKGDRVVLISGNRPEYLDIFLGCAWIGAVAVPINTAARGFQLQNMLQNCGAKICFLDPDHIATLQSVDMQEVPLDTIFTFDDCAKDSLENVEVRDLPQLGEAAEEASIEPGDPLIILYTSGTTGLSKGVICPHAQFFWWSVLAAKQLGIVRDDVLHTTLPLFHVNALTCFFQALLFGASQVVGTRFSVTTFWDDLIACKATVTYLLGAMVPMLLSREPRDAEVQHSVRVALAPGVPASAQQPFMDRSAIVLLDGYGSTETNAVIGCDATNYRPDTMGKLKDGIQARVVDSMDQEVPDGEPGELLLRADEPYCFASGYYKTPEKTVEAWRNLWFHTGDQVIRGKDGYFKFLDRTKDSIRRRGENISSFEVEQVLNAHPAVSVAAVFAVPSELGEDEVMATIVPNDGMDIEEVEIIRFCESRMSYFSIPRFVQLTQDLPRTESGKIQKFKLRERGRTDDTWDREVAGVKIKR